MTGSDTSHRGERTMNASLAMKSYHHVHAAGSVTDASPHRLIQMLMQETMNCLKKAEGFLEYGNIPGRTHNINRAVEMISYLRDCLNINEGGEIAANLDKLYGYMLRRLFEANSYQDKVALEEVSSLMATVKEGWDGISNA